MLADSDTDLFSTNAYALLDLPNSNSAAKSFVNGIDVSHFQGDVDFEKLKRAGIIFVYVKATEGATVIDANFSRNWKAAKDAGIIRGAYHLFRPTSDVQKQIAHFASVVGKLENGDLPPVLDIEVPEDWTHLAVAVREKIVLRWLQGVEVKLGVRPIIYSNNSMTKDVLQSSASLKNYLLWIAYYTTGQSPLIPSPWKDWSFWQHSKTGSVDGISGLVDLDRFNGTLADLAKIQVVLPTNPLPNPMRTSISRSFLVWLRRWFRKRP